VPIDRFENLEEETMTDYETNLRLVILGVKLVSYLGPHQIDNNLNGITTARIVYHSHTEVI
jgi:hypothetical protein